MTYTPTVWVDNAVPAIDAANLNKMEAGIKNAQGNIIVLRGLLSARPASDAILVGRLYIATDTSELFRDNGTTWDQIIFDHADLANVTADQHHAGFIALEDNAGAVVSPAADDRVQFTDDGVVNADAAGNTIVLSIAEDQIVLRGLTAALPAPDPLRVGRLYIESDLLQRVWRDNGAGWDQVNLVAGYPAPLLDTGQTTCYSVFDDGDQELGTDKAYTITATAGNTNIQVAHYAVATITFATADNSITDSAAGLVTFLSADTIVIKGSLSNDGTYTIAAGTGGTAGHFHVNEALVDEVAGRMVSFYKQTAHANIVVQDTKTGRMWSQTTSNGEKVGVLSNGTLAWTGIVFPLYSSANTISMIVPGNILRITGGAALTQFHVGDLLQCGGFASAINNLANLYVLSVTVNAGNLDIVVDPGNEVLIAEGAVGDTIGLVTRCIYNYMAGARLAGLSGYTDWREPNREEMDSLGTNEAPTGVPNAVAFPGWATLSYWTATTAAYNTTLGVVGNFAGYMGGVFAKTTPLLSALVRS